jgi:UDP-N-acetylglucosamine 1-carboxyvinyltransferase
LVEGGIPLRGEVSLQGAKNAALPLLAASLLTDEAMILENVPRLEDTLDLGLFLKLLGVSIRRESTRLTVRAGTLKTTVIPRSFQNRTRHSLLALGPLLARFGEAEISFPAGCPIGDRRFDYHLEGLKRMGATIELLPNRIRARAGGLSGTEFHFPYPSFSGTLNLLFAASLARGRTVLKNAAVNPEVDDAVSCLIAMGAKVTGKGTRTLAVEGRKKLHGARHRVMDDRIELFTLICAGAITGGEVFVRGGGLSLIAAEAETLAGAGVVLRREGDGVSVSAPGPLRGRPVVTAAYPGFHTDNQPAFCALMARARGESSIRETILDNRFAYVPELNRFGAEVSVDNGGFLCVNGRPGLIARITGERKLRGASVRAGDIRGGAALLLAALAASGKSRILNVYQIERGYADLPGKIRALGGKVERQ